MVKNLPDDTDENIEIQIRISRQTCEHQYKYRLLSPSCGAYGGKRCYDVRNDECASCYTPKRFSVLDQFKNRKD